MKKNFFLLFGLAVMAASCGRDGVIHTPYALTDNDKGFVVDLARSEFISGDVEAIADMAMLSQSASFNGCMPAITLDTNIKRLIIDFGAECKDADQVVRKGRIIVNYTRHYFDSGAVKTITFDNYHYAGDRLTGYKKIENRGYYGNGNYYASVVMADTLYVGGGEGFISWYGERKRIQVDGYSTNYTGDDTYEVTGSGSVKRVNGQYCDNNILSSLLLTNECKYPKSGVLQLVPRNGVARTLDFGSGGCDNKASLEINATVFDIDL